jgi:hypothetical protein
MALNSNALVSLEDLRTYLCEKTTEFETLMELIINGVSAEFDRYTGRTLKQATYTNLYLDGNGQDILNLPNWPAASLGTVTEDGTALTEGLDYDFVLYTSNEDAYLQKIQSTWPELDEETAVWLAGPKTILISTVALGYATVPGDLLMACLKQCAREYQTAKQKAWGETNRSVADGSVGLVAPGLLPDVEKVLKGYRRLKV